MLSTVLLAMNITLMYAMPLIFASLGGVISERSGVINIGIEGMMTIGCFFAATVGFYSGSAWLGLLAGGVAGALLALLHAFASVTLKADQTISGIALNFIGPGVALFVSRLVFDGATTTKTVPNKLPKVLGFIDGINKTKYLTYFNFDIGAIIAIVFALLMWFFFYKTKWGLRVRAVGEHPAAADTLGVNVYKVRYACVILSGFLAGLGGATMSLSIISQFRPTAISGQGFIALAAVIFGKWSPHGALGACMLFGFAQALSVLLGGGTINTNILAMIPYVITIAVMIIFVGKSVAPKADGAPYEKGQR